MLVTKRALAPLLGDLRAAADAAARLAETHRDTPIIGRTLLQQAKPTTFGLKAAGWMLSLDDAADHLHSVRLPRRSCGGPGPGTLDAASSADALAIVAGLARQLHLDVPVLPWHTLRGRIGELAGALGVAAGVVGKAARDITLLAQTEVGEVREAAPGGSTSMPHKRNPVAAISALGCAQQAPGAGRDPAGRDGAGARARRRRLAQRMAAAVRPADHHRLRRRPGCAPASRAWRSTPSACWPTSATPATPAPPPSSSTAHWSTDDPPPRRHRETGRRSSSRTRSAPRCTCGTTRSTALAEHFTADPLRHARPRPVRDAARPVHDRRPRPGRDRPARPPRDRARPRRRALARRHDRDVARASTRPSGSRSSCCCARRRGWARRRCGPSASSTVREQGTAGDRRRDARALAHRRLRRPARHQLAARDVHRHRRRGLRATAAT